MQRARLEDTPWRISWCSQMLIMTLKRLWRELALRAILVSLPFFCLDWLLDEDDVPIPMLPDFLEPALQVCKIAAVPALTPRGERKYPLPCPDVHMHCPLEPFG